MKTRSFVAAAALLCMMMSCGNEPAVLDGSWSVDSLNGEAVESVEKTVFVSFDAAEGNVSGCLGVNNLLGKYTQEGETVSFGQMGTTMMAGLPEDMETEAKLLEAFGQVAKAEVDGDALTLSSEDGTVVIKLSRLAAEEAVPVTPIQETPEEAAPAEEAPAAE